MTPFSGPEFLTCKNFPWHTFRIIAVLNLFYHVISPVGEWHFEHNQPLLTIHKIFTIGLMENRGLYLGAKAQIENPAVLLWQAWRNLGKQYETITENAPEICIENCSEKCPENCPKKISLNSRPKISTDFTCVSAASAAACPGRLGALCSILPANCLTNASAKANNWHVLLPSSKRTAGFHQLKGLVWWDGWGLTANWTMKWHVQGRAPGSNSLDRIARFALNRVNTAPKLPKTNKTHFFGKKQFHKSSSAATSDRENEGHRKSYICLSPHFSNPFAAPQLKTRVSAQTNT